MKISDLDEAKRLVAVRNHHKTLIERSKVESVTLWYGVASIQGGAAQYMGTVLRPSLFREYLQKELQIVEEELSILGVEL